MKKIVFGTEKNKKTLSKIEETEKENEVLMEEEDREEEQMVRKTDDESTSEKYEDVEYIENCNV